MTAPASAMRGVLAVAAAGAVGCSVSAGAVQNAGAAEVPFETVLKEGSSGLEEPLREAIRTGDDWSRLWERIHAGTSPSPPPPEVDFSREMLIAVARGTRPSGGFGIAVRRIARRDGKLEVTVLRTCPPPGAMVSMGLTQPVHVVRLPKLDAPVVYRDEASPDCD